MITFLMIARVLYDKGYQQFVDAAKVLTKEFNNVNFSLLGDVDEEYPNNVPRNIIEQDVSNGFISYLGYIPDVYNVIKNADCIVLPTFYNEGLSRVLMEGLAMSKPIITTNIPGCKETVVNGVNGFLCEPKDTLSLINACRKFLYLSENDRHAMGRAGREIAESKFDVRDVIKVYSSITNKYL